MGKMKDSGIDWIGDIPESWKIVRNKNLFNCTKIIVGEDWKKNQLLSLTTKGVVKKEFNNLLGKLPESFSTYQRVNKNNMIMCLFDLDCSAVFSGISRYDGIISPAYKILNCKKNIFPLYADFWFRFIFQGRKFKIYSKNLRYTLSYDEFSVLPIITPNFDEQQKIANFLDKKCGEIDNIITRTKATIEEYKKLKQSVITQRKIPIDWLLIRIKWLLNERNERSVLGKEEPLSMSQKYGIIPTKQMDIIPNMASSFIGAKLCYKNDLIFNKLKAHLGVFAVSNYDGLVSPDYAVYYSTNRALLKFLEYLFKTPQYIGEFRKKSTGVGAGLTRLYTSELFSIYCAIPPICEQYEIIDYLNKKCSEIDKLIQKKEQLLDELENYKKSLIYEYVTGKKEV